MRPGAHQRLDRKHISHINMTCGIDSRRSVVRGQLKRKLCLVHCSTIQSCINSHLVLSNITQFHHRRLLARCAVSVRAANNGLLQRQLESTENDGVKVVRFESGDNGDTVARAVARMVSFDHQSDTVLGELPLLWLTVHGPSRVKFMFVNDDGCYLFGDDVLPLAQECSRWEIEGGELKVGWRSRHECYSLFTLCTHGCYELILNTR